MEGELHRNYEATLGLLEAPGRVRVQRGLWRSARRVGALQCGAEEGERGCQTEALRYATGLLTSAGSVSIRNGGAGEQVWHLRELKMDPFVCASLTEPPKAISKLDLPLQSLAAPRGPYLRPQETSQIRLLPTAGLMASARQFAPNLSVRPGQFSALRHPWQHQHQQRPPVMVNLQPPWAAGGVVGQRPQHQLPMHPPRTSIFSSGAVPAAGKGAGKGKSAAPDRSAVAPWRAAVPPASRKPPLKAPAVTLRAGPAAAARQASGGGGGGPGAASYRKGSRSRSRGGAGRSASAAEASKRPWRDVRDTGGPLRGARSSAAPPERTRRSVHHDRDAGHSRRSPEPTRGLKRKSVDRARQRRHRARASSSSSLSSSSSRRSAPPRRRGGGGGGSGGGGDRGGHGGARGRRSRSPSSRSH